MKQLTDQELFDKSVGGVIAQGGPAIDGGFCVYRTKEGRKCAAGQLIFDSEYQPGIEGCSLDTFHMDLAHEIQRAALVASGVAENQLPLVVKLQKLHDRLAITFRGSDAEFLKAFKLAAYGFGLAAGFNKSQTYF